MRETIDGRHLMTDDRILWHGRVYGEYARARIDGTLAGFAVTIEGDELVGYAHFEEEVYLAVFVDGKFYSRIRCVKLAEEQKVVFCENLNPVIHRVDVFRLTEQKHGCFMLTALSARAILGGEHQPKERKELITFYGDSLTCGYGVEGKPGEEFSPATENPLKSYAYTLCDRRNADGDYFSFSGISVSEKIFVPEFTLGEICFGYSAYNRSRYPYPRKSDLVVINVGTNDGCAIDGGVGDGKRLKENYLAFVRKVAQKHAEAKIVLTYGFMDRVPDQKEAVEHAYGVLHAEQPDRYYVFAFPRNVDGANGHPNAEGQILGGNLLADYLEKEGV